MSLTVPQIINIAKISQYLCVNDKEKSGLFGGGTPNDLGNLIQNVRKSVEWKYGQNPAETTLTKTANYLYSLCGKYGFAAKIVVGTGGTVANTAVSGTIVPYLIPVVSADFVSATIYNDPRLVGRTYEIFWNELSRFLNVNTEFAPTASGVQILLDGFDATANEYHLYIYLLD